MPRFAYHVRDASGQTGTGVLTANDPLEASNLLRREGNVVVSLREEQSHIASAAPVRRKRIKKDDVIYFTTQLAVMVDTGVPISEALDAIASQCDHPSLQVVIQDLSDEVKAGTEFSSALQKHPKIFNRLFLALMRASEVSGTMGNMLERTSEYMTREQQTRKQIKGALTYPLCMLCFCLLVVVGLLIFIMPKFEKIYAGKGAVLPLPTRLLLGLSNGLIDYWPFVTAGVVALAVGGWFYFSSPGGKIFLDRARIRLPIFGKMYRTAYLARSLRTMATMVSTGVNMLDGLSITAQVAGNYFYQKIWLDLAESVKEGATLSAELAGCALIPRTVGQMIAAGERTGKLSLVMNRVADFYEEQLKVSVKTVTSMIEPLMIIVMGILIGGIAMALLLPIFSISKVIAK